MTRVVRRMKIMMGLGGRTRDRRMVGKITRMTIKEDKVEGRTEEKKQINRQSAQQL